MENKIKDKVIVITGASSGLGEAAARLLSNEGAIVVLAARRKDKLESLVNEIKNNGQRATAIETDVTDAKQVQDLVDAAVKEYGKIDVMINNAGLMQQSLLEDAKITEWNNMIDINIKGVLYGIAAALKHMKVQKFGHIINVASVSGHKTGIGDAIYAATKHSVRVISEVLRQEVKPYNLRTTIVSPGAVDSELAQHITAEGFGDNVRKFYETTAIPSSSFAEVVGFAISQPESVDINEILFRPTVQQL
ncbi:MAG: SDR family oxidoreductase [Breznakibacter sp.]